MLFHGNKTTNISTTNWASVFCFYKTFATVSANTKVTAWHN